MKKKDTTEKPETKELDEEVAQMPIRRCPENRIYLRQHGAHGKLPDGREFDIGSTCGFGGTDLVLVVYGGKGGTFIVNARDMLEALLAKGVL